MEQVIEINLIEADDLLDKYNKEKISLDFINYLIESSSYYDKKDKVKIIINNSISDDNDYIKLIYQGLRNEYKKSYQKHKHINYLQLIYFVLGIITLAISSIINEEVLKELILIGGWVFIWTMAELEIFSDMEERHRRMILKKLLNSEILEKKI